MIRVFLVLTALQAADGYLTWRILAGGGSERNPLMRRWLALAGTLPGLVLAKVAVQVLAWMFLRELSIVLIALAVVYAIVVLHNCGQLRSSIS
jgi:hypothetical protein